MDTQRVDDGIPVNQGRGWVDGLPSNFFLRIFSILGIFVDWAR